MVCCGFPGSRAVGHHAPSIRLGDRDCNTLRLESHRHLRISTIASIVGEFATSIRLTCSFMIHLSCYIPNRQIPHPAETAMMESFHLGNRLTVGKVSHLQRTTMQSLLYQQTACFSDPVPESLCETR
jgi:hypothetical protein